MLRLQILESKGVSWLVGRLMAKGARSCFAVEGQSAALRVIVEAVARDGSARGRRGEGFILSR